MRVRSEHDWDPEGTRFCVRCGISQSLYLQGRGPICQPPANLVAMSHRRAQQLKEKA